MPDVGPTIFSVVGGLYGFTKGLLVGIVKPVDGAQYPDQGGGAQEPAKQSKAEVQQQAAPESDTSRQQVVSSAPASSTLQAAQAVTMSAGPRKPVKEEPSSPTSTLDLATPQSPISKAYNVPGPSAAGHETETNTNRMSFTLADMLKVAASLPPDEAAVYDKDVVTYLYSWLTFDVMQHHDVTKLPPDKPDEDDVEDKASLLKRLGLTNKTKWLLHADKAGLVCYLLYKHHEQVHVTAAQKVTPDHIIAIRHHQLFGRDQPNPQAADAAVAEAYPMPRRWLNIFMPCLLEGHQGGGFGIAGAITMKQLQQVGEWEDADEEQRLFYMEKFLGQPVPPRPLQSGWTLDMWVAMCLRYGIAFWL